MTDGSNRIIDCLIVGQGLAGSLLARELIRHGLTIHVIDKGHSESSSRVAAGIINPVTGRYFVKSWMIDKLMPIARSTYKEIENEFNITLWQDRSLYRALPDEKAINEWHARSTRPGWGKYMQGTIPGHKGLDQFNNIKQWGVTMHAAQVDLTLLLTRIRVWLSEKEILFTDEFHHENIVPNEKPLSYNGFRYKHLIFSEGSGVRKNPFFNYLPFRPVKGEVFHLQMPGLPDGSIVKNKLLFAPLGDGTIWVGANYDHNFTNHLPSHAGELWLKHKLTELLDQPWEVINHEAGIRPSTNDRRPIIGRHPMYSNMYILNGFGTKGTSLAPYFTRQFVNWLLNDDTISEEVSVERFEYK